MMDAGCRNAASARFGVVGIQRTIARRWIPALPRAPAGGRPHGKGPSLRRALLHAAADVVWLPSTPSRCACHRWCSSGLGSDREKQVQDALRLPQPAIWGHCYFEIQRTLAQTLDSGSASSSCSRLRPP